MSGLALQREMTLDRLSGRLWLLKEIEARLGYLGQSLDAQRLDDYNELAYNLLSSPAAKRAFDLAREPQAVRDRYGRNRYGQSYLMARRRRCDDLSCDGDFVGHDGRRREGPADLSL